LFRLLVLVRKVSVFAEILRRAGLQAVLVSAASVRNLTPDGEIQFSSAFGMGSRYDQVQPN
jgi:hypothetical protein